MPDEENSAAGKRGQSLRKPSEIPHQPICERSLSLRREPTRPEEGRQSARARSVQNHVGVEALLARRSLDEQLERALAPQRVARVIASEHSGAADRDDPVMRADASGESRRRRDRREHPFDHFRSGQEHVVGRHPAA